MGIRVHVDQPAPVLTERSRPVLPVALRAIATVDSPWLVTVVADALRQHCAAPAALLRERVALGESRYGVELHTHCGRDLARDLREELADAVLYAVAVTMEKAQD